MVVAARDDWKSSQLRVQTDPRAPEEIVKDVVLFSVAIQEA